MIYKSIDLSEEFSGIKKDASGRPVFSMYIPDNFEQIDINRKRPSVIICPGGGYHFHSNKEGEPIALAFMGRGFNAFVLEYTVYPDGGHPLPLLQAAAAVAYIRRHADELHADENAIAVLGFSAGGHVAGTIGTLWKDNIVGEALGTKPDDVRPDALVLCYAVLANKHSHAGSFEKVGNNNEETMEYLSIDKRVADDTPPAYLFTTADDKTVLPQSTLLTALALQEHHVPYELHVYRHGVHGMALATHVTHSSDSEEKIDNYVSGWVGEAVHFLKDLFYKKNL